MTRYWFAMTLALLLAACATPFNAPRIEPGMPLAQVIAQWGPPTRSVALPGGGQRLQYSLQPAGQYAWMVDFDGAQKAIGARQVMTEREFQRIVPGTWTRADVEREFGPPARVDGVASWDGPVLSYRWKDVQNADMFYWIYLDRQGIVRRAHPGMEFLDRLFDGRS